MLTPLSPLGIPRPSAADQLPITGSQAPRHPPPPVHPAEVISHRQEYLALDLAIAHSHPVAHRPVLPSRDGLPRAHTEALGLDHADGLDKSGTVPCRRRRYRRQPRKGRPGLRRHDVAGRGAEHPQPAARRVGLGRPAGSGVCAACSIPVMPPCPVSSPPFASLTVLLDVSRARGGAWRGCGGCP
jgi:hypothetical protein